MQELKDSTALYLLYSVLPLKMANSPYISMFELGWRNYTRSILKPSYIKTLQVWKGLVVERFEELNVDINQLPIKQYAYDYHDYHKKDAS